MSCNYADGLSPYENKGILGVPEKFDSTEDVESKSKQLADWIKQSRHVVFHTGAGISTSAGIPDFRSPTGVWTLEKQGKKPEINLSFDDAIPTKTHMALAELIKSDLASYIVSQNIDGLHLKSGISREYIAELHGNMYIEQCNVCNSKYVRNTATTTVGKKLLGVNCRRMVARGRACRGKLQDTILDWEDNLPDDDLEMADYHSNVADLNICLGSTLQIVPSGNLPTKNKKYGGKLVIVNLQPTKHDKKADLIIHSYVDVVMEKVMKKLDLEIPEYSKQVDPTKKKGPDEIIEWNIESNFIDKIKKLYDIYCKSFKKRQQKYITDAKEKKLKRDEETKEEEVKSASIKNQAIKDETLPPCN